MGTPLALVLANIYWGILEEDLKMGNEKDSFFLWPSLYKRPRFVDDVFGVFEGHPNNIVLFAQHFNDKVPTIEMEIPHSGSHVIFMDLRLIIYKGTRFRQTGFLEIKIYQKEISMNICSYIPVHSAHSPYVFKNFIKGEINRYLRYNSNESCFWSIVLNIFRRLRLSVTPENYWSLFFLILTIQIKTNCSFLLPVCRTSSSRGLIKDLGLLSNWLTLQSKAILLIKAGWWKEIHCF